VDSPAEHTLSLCLADCIGCMDYFDHGIDLPSPEDYQKQAEQGGGLNGYPRHDSCFLATLGAGVAPRAAVSHLGR